MGIAKGRRMPPQLVGSECAVCQKRISSILEGAFCKACGSPIHFQCQSRLETAEPSDRCVQCGAVRASSGMPAMAAPEAARPIGMAEGYFMILRMASDYLFCSWLVFHRHRHSVDAGRNLHVQRSLSERTGDTRGHDRVRLLLLHILAVHSKAAGWQ